VGDQGVAEGRHGSLKNSSDQKIRIGHSPDADDAFMFYALAKGKIPSDGFQVEHVIEDIETLNQRAFRAELEVTALSCHAFGFLSDRYRLLPYGSSVGEGYGPILVRKKNGTPSVRGSRIAVPGRYTTAFLVLQLYEADFQPVFIPFDQIFSALQNDKADFGLLIHEGQLTYQELGFEKIVDLGEWWKEKYDLPLPLGINAIRRDLDPETIARFTRLFKKSLDYAMAHRSDALEYALEFGRGMDVKKGDRFVGMYVNHYALDLGEKGVSALELLFDLGWKKGFLPGRVNLDGVKAQEFSATGSKSGSRSS